MQKWTAHNGSPIPPGEEKGVLTQALTSPQGVGTPALVYNYVVSLHNSPYANQASAVGTTAYPAPSHSKSIITEHSRYVNNLSTTCS